MSLLKNINNFSEHIQKDSVLAKEKEYNERESIIIQNEDEHQYQSFSELFVQQFTWTIEFTLGIVSNTASYLRLWALSLAHCQLASIFYDKLMNDIGISEISDYSYVYIFLIFPVYITATFLVLICMNSLEWFLHILRLHWIEFQSKFYKGDGYLFEPLSFEKELESLRRHNEAQDWWNKN